MSFVLPAQTPCLMFFTSVACFCSQHWSLLHVHCSCILSSSYTGLDHRSAFLPPSGHSVTNSLLCKCRLPSHTHLQDKPSSTKCCIPAPVWTTACSYWITSLSLFLRQCSLFLDPVEWSSGLDDIRGEEGLRDSRLARSRVLLLQYCDHFIFNFFRNLYFSNSGLQMRNMFHV